MLYFGVASHPPSAYSSTALEELARVSHMCCRCRSQHKVDDTV